MGFRPIHPSVAVQRDADGATSGRAATPSEAGDAPGPPVAARWGRGETLPETIVSRSPGVPGPARPGVQLSPRDPVAPMGGVTTMVDLSPTGLPDEIVFPPRDAGSYADPALLDAGPVAISPAPWSGARPPSIASSAPGLTSAPGSASRASAPAPARPLTLARSAAGSPAVAPSQGGGSPAAPVIARIVADPSTPGAAPSVQTTSSSGTGGLPVAAITATPIVQRADGAAPPVESGPQGHSDTELDDLARALFGRIRTHLRAEVIHEREAKGLSFDAF